MRWVTSLLLVVTTLLGCDRAQGAPPTTLTPNGLGTSVVSPAPGFYNIQGGTPEGNNLFHSFSTFNLGMGDTANFNVAGNIANILARVTGGASSIDGTITSTVGANGPMSTANLFLINPAGVMFTDHAQVNLGGSFVVSSANVVQFSDGTSFHADTTHPVQDALLSSAAVSAFGFLTPTPQPISFLGSQLAAQPGTGFHVIGGDITLDQGTGANPQGATLSAPSGSVTFFSAASSGQVPFSLASPGAGYANATNTSFGNITMNNGSLVSINGGGGGGVVIRGGRLAVDNSSITSYTFGGTQDGDISIAVQTLSLTSGAVVNTDTYGTADAGSIFVNVTGNANISGTDMYGNGSEIAADTETGGNGGTLSVTTGGSLTLDNKGSILANPDGSGAVGMVAVTAGSAQIGSESSISATGGTVAVNVSGGLNMTDDGEIDADTYGSVGGNTIVHAGQLTMSGTSLIDSNAAAGSNSGGQVEVDAGSISIQGTGHLFLYHGGLFGLTGITAEALIQGNAGSIKVTTGNLNLNGGAVISANNFGSANGGSVTVDCSQGVLSNQSEISATSVAQSAGAINIVASDSLSVSGGSLIDTSAAVNGGNINLRVGRLLYLNNSDILAYAGVQSYANQTVGGNGGNIRIDPQFVVLGNSLISANDLSSIGSDGNIVNLTDFFFTSNSVLHATGTIETTPVDLNLANGLVVLPGNLVDNAQELRERCASAINHEFSSLIVVGRGGTETAPEELKADSGMDLRR